MLGLLAKWGWALVPVVVRAINLGLDYLEIALKKKQKEIFEVEAASVSHSEGLSALQNARDSLKAFKEFVKTNNI